QAVLIPPERLQALFVEEAELGERIMRALILRRMVLLERGVGGPILVGRRASADVLRLSGFLARNAHPQQLLAPGDEKPGPATLMESFRAARQEPPLALARNGRVLRTPPEAQLARSLGLVRLLDPEGVYAAAGVGAGPAGLAAAVYAATEGLQV